MTESSVSDSPPSPAHCLKCGYALTGLEPVDAAVVCPECGRTNTLKDRNFPTTQPKTIMDCMSPYILLAAISLSLGVILPVLGFVSFAAGVIPAALCSTMAAESAGRTRSARTGRRFVVPFVIWVLVLEVLAIGVNILALVVVAVLWYRIVDAF